MSSSRKSAIENKRWNMFVKPLFFYSTFTNFIWIWKKDLKKTLDKNLVLPGTEKVYLWLAKISRNF